MTGDRRILLYVGSDERCKALQAAVGSRDWHVYGATEAREALALYSFYWPHAVVVESVPESDVAEVVYYHLTAIDAVPLLVLTHEKAWTRWDARVTAPHRLLPRKISDGCVVQTLETLFAGHVDRLRSRVA